jgi:arylformamidase
MEGTEPAPPVGDAALEAAYDLRTQVPTYPEDFARWEAASAAVRAGLPHARNVAYGPHGRMRLDLFPAAERGTPLVVFLHGGYWRTLDKDYFSFPAAAFVEAGIAYAAVGYGLCPDVTMDTLVGQVRDALVWLYAHAGDYGIDRDRIVVAGHSAGAHLAAMLATTDWPPRSAAANPVKASCAISGAYDLEPIRRTSINADLRLDEAAARRNSPIRRLSAARGRLVLALGELEHAEFHRQQAEFAAAWRDAGLADPAELIVPARHHFDVIDEMARPESRLHAAILELVAAA